MKEKIDHLRSIGYVMIPEGFTYFDHHTTYMPQEIKDRFVSGKYTRNWNTLPTDEFTVRGEMSFTERDQRIGGTLEYRKPLSETDITYQLPDYSKPFCIRVIIPQIESIRSGKFQAGEDYRKTMEKIYGGYGDGRHQKLANGEKIIIIGNSMEDEISGKKIDVFYGVRERDLDFYFDKSAEAWTTGYSMDCQPNISQGRFSKFYSGSYVIPKSMNMERYQGSPSEFEAELYDDYKDYIPESGPIEKIPIPEHYHFYKLYNNYANKGSMGMK